MSKILKLILVLLLGVAIGAGGLYLINKFQQSSKEIIPIDQTPISAGSGKVAYQVCKNTGSGERIYFLQSCGIDSCFEIFYDKSGGFIEKASEGMVPHPQRPKTQVSDCVRTTKEYFVSKIKDKNIPPTEL